MNREELRRLWKEEEAHSVSGWDFSHIEGRCAEAPLPWEYRAKVKDFLKPGVKLLDMGTGGGEFLLSLGYPYGLTSVTEGYEPNYQLCLRRLAPLGIDVRKYDSDSDRRMPFPDEAFDLVINRHESYDIAEVRRVLKPGGFFLTQQVGGQNSRILAKRLLPEFDRPMKDFNLENEAPKFRKAGFRVMYCHQAYPIERFFDIGALCFQAKLTPWEFSGFSVDCCFDGLLQLQKELEERGFVENQEHRFILIAKKRAEALE